MKLWCIIPGIGLNELSCQWKEKPESKHFYNVFPINYSTCCFLSAHAAFKNLIFSPVNWPKENFIFIYFLWIFNLWLILLIFVCQQINKYIFWKIISGSLQFCFQNLKIWVLPRFSFVFQGYSLAPKISTRYFYSFSLKYNHVLHSRFLIKQKLIEKIIF